VQWTRTSTSAPAPKLFTDGQRAQARRDGPEVRVYHVIDAATMAPVWKTPVGAPCRRGHRRFHGRRRHGHSTDRSPRAGICGARQGRQRRVGSTPSATVCIGATPSRVGNGIVYTVDLKSFLDAYDGRLGTPLLHRPIARRLQTGSQPVASWGGVSVAANTVYAQRRHRPAFPTGFIVGRSRPRRRSAVAGYQPPPPPPTTGPAVGGQQYGRRGPGLGATTYFTPTVTIQQASRLSFTNLDVPSTTSSQQRQLRRALIPPDRAHQSPGSRAPAWQLRLLLLPPPQHDGKRSASTDALRRARPSAASPRVTGKASGHARLGDRRHEVGVAVPRGKDLQVESGRARPRPAPPRLAPSSARAACTPPLMAAAPCRPAPPTPPPPPARSAPRSAPTWRTGTP